MESESTVDQPMLGDSIRGESNSTILAEIDAQALDNSRSEEEDAGYNGGGEQDSDSDDGGLTMG